MTRYLGPLEDGTYILKLNCKETWEESDDTHTKLVGCPIDRRYNLTQQQLEEYVEHGTGDWMDDWAKDPVCDYHRPEEEGSDSPGE